MSRGERHSVVDWAYLIALAIGNAFRRPRQHDDGVRSVLVLCTAGIGDTLWATPVFRALRRRYHDAAIVALVLKPRGTQQLLERMPFVDECIAVDWNYRAVPGGLARLLRLVRRRRFDVTVSAYPGAGLGSRILAQLIGAPVRIGYEGFGSSFVLSLAAPLNTKRHSLKINLDLARELGDMVEDARLDLPLDDDDRAFATAFLRQNDGTPGAVLVGVHPGTFPDLPEKSWRPERFAQVIDALQSEAGVKALLFGGPQDEEAVKRILSAVAGEAPLLATGVTIRQMAALFRQCRLLITNDSGPLHVAEAVGTPAVALFGPTDPALVGPFDPSSDRYTVVRKEVGCGPCYRHKKIDCPHGVRCMEEIAVADVLEAAMERLKAGGNGNRRNGDIWLLGERQHAEV